jgi:two-component system response regulator FixJ
LGDSHPLGRRPTIVIVEDDPSLLGALSFALEADGFIVHAFESSEALLLSPILADCMVIDQRLEDIDGLALIGRLRTIGISSPAILITTNPTARTRRRAAAAGVRIVEKPLVTGELRNRINEVIRGAVP